MKKFIVDVSETYTVTADHKITVYGEDESVIDKMDLKTLKQNYVLEFVQSEDSTESTFALGSIKVEDVTGFEAIFWADEELVEELESNFTFVSKDEAAKFWDKTAIFGIDAEGREGLIESEEDLDRHWTAFGMEK